MTAWRRPGGGWRRSRGGAGGAGTLGRSERRAPAWVGTVGGWRGDEYERLLHVSAGTVPTVRVPPQRALGTTPRPPTASSPLAARTHLVASPLAAAPPPPPPMPPPRQRRAAPPRFLARNDAAQLPERPIGQVKGGRESVERPPKRPAHHRHGRAQAVGGSDAAQRAPS